MYKKKTAEDSDVLINRLTEQYSNTSFSEAKTDIDSLVLLGIIFDTERDKILEQLEHKQKEPEETIQQKKVEPVMDDQNKVQPTVEPTQVKEPGSETVYERPEIEEKPKDIVTEHMPAQLEKTFTDVMRAGSLYKGSTIRKEDDGWHVYSEKGKHIGGPYPSEERAKKRLHQIEYFKHKGSKDGIDILFENYPNLFADRNGTILDIGDAIILRNNVAKVIDINVKMASKFPIATVDIILKNGMKIRNISPEKLKIIENS